MRWSPEVARVAGVRVKIHVTFWIIVAWFAILGWRDGGGLWGMATEVFFVLALFSCVVLHELGHALVAARYGIRTRDITLLPIGGVARLERMPDKPRQELLVALAGPAVNVAIAGLLAVALALWSPEVLSAPAANLFEGSLAARLMVINVALVVFNMLPAFPMDGGRVLRALLAMRLDYAVATRAAATVGQGAALVFAFLGLIAGNPFLLFIAFFVWIGAASEASVVELKATLAGIPVASAMMTEFSTLAVGESLARVVDLILAGSQKEFPVLAGERVVGVVTERRVISALSSIGIEAAVEDAMETDLRTAEPREMLGSVLERLGASAGHTVPVLSDSRLVGLLTQENLNEMLQLRAALGKTSAGSVRSILGRRTGS